MWDEANMVLRIVRRVNSGENHIPFVSEGVLEEAIFVGHTVVRTRKGYTEA